MQLAQAFLFMLPTGPAASCRSRHPRSFSTQMEIGYDLFLSSFYRTNPCSFAEAVEYVALQMSLPSHPACRMRPTFCVVPSPTSFSDLMFYDAGKPTHGIGTAPGIGGMSCPGRPFPSRHPNTCSTLLA